jgi:hypothetical protein
VPYTVPSGTAFYVNSLRVYDQNFLIQEQKMRDTRDKFGPTSKEFLNANEIYLNNKKLLQNKKKEMNNVLRTFAFDRRQDGSFKPVTVPTADSLKNAATAKVGALVSGSASLPSSTSLLAAGADALTGAVSSTASNLEEGVVGVLEDGSIVYSYERTVNDFLTDELSSLAFRARMLKLDDLKEFALAITGISAPDLFAGVQEKKRLKLKQQQDIIFAKQADAAAAAEAQALLDGAGDLGDGVVGEMLQEESIDTTGAVSSGLTEQVGSSVTVSSPSDSIEDLLSGESVDEGSSLVASPFEGGSNVEAAMVSQEVTTVSASADAPPVPAVVPIEPIISTVPASNQIPFDVTIDLADLDQVVASASAQGMKLYVSDDEISTLFDDLDTIYQDAKKASLDKDAKEFAESLKDFVFTCAQVSTPSGLIISQMVSVLEKIVGLMSFVGFDNGFEDEDTFENLLQIVMYLKGGLLSSQVNRLVVIEDKLNAWIKLH